MNTRKLASFAAALALAFTAAAFADAGKTKLYKWVDKNGVTQYGSSIPPEYASQGGQQLNAQGQVISTQSAQKTPEQLAAEAAAQKQADQQAQIAADAKKRDQVLLDTYTSVADMEQDRDSKVSAIDAQINVLNGSITSSQTSLAEFQGRASELSSKNKPIPDDLQKHIDAARNQLVTNQQQLLKQQQHKLDIQGQFVKDIERYKELTGQQASSSGG